MRGAEKATALIAYVVYYFDVGRDLPANKKCVARCFKPSSPCVANSHPRLFFDLLVWRLASFECLLFVSFAKAHYPPRRRRQYCPAADDDDTWARTQEHKSE